MQDKIVFITPDIADKREYLSIDFEEKMRREQEAVLSSLSGKYDLIVMHDLYSAEVNAVVSNGTRCLIIDLPYERGNGLTPQTFKPLYQKKPYAKALERVGEIRGNCSVLVYTGASPSDVNDDVLAKLGIEVIRKDDLRKDIRKIKLCLERRLGSSP